VDSVDEEIIKQEFELKKKNLSTNFLNSSIDYQKFHD